MRHVRKLLQLIRHELQKGWMQYAYCRHRFEATKRSNERAPGRHRYMSGSHLCIPWQISIEIYRILGLNLTLVRILYSQFNTCCLTAAIIA
jgi:hypothetical protein